jgi:hypothetical protein
MSRIPTPATIETAPEKAQTLLSGVKDQLGVLPNMLRLISNSPQTLEGHLVRGPINHGRAVPLPIRITP